MIHEIVQRYAAAVNAADPAMLERLFTEDAVLRNPFGTYTGTDEIMGFYRDVVLAGQAVVTPGDGLADGALVMTELVATSPLDPEATPVHAIDVFRLAPDGRIAALDIYYR